MTQAWGIWVELRNIIKHPELNHFTAKNLRDHADRIKKKQVVMTTESLNNVTSTNSVDEVLSLTMKYYYKKHQKTT